MFRQISFGDGLIELIMYLEWRKLWFLEEELGQNQEFLVDLDPGDSKSGYSPLKKSCN